ncbi:putative amidohydrolase [metagenome]|uniref:Putative amidohydrolase n=1 Tax=metagenome TaxID=256318 RepID=A0A2P2BYS6_9ZZZZ
MTRVAACQLSLQVGHAEVNRARADAAVRAAVAGGAEFVVLPELVSSGYVFRDADEARSLAETVSGPTLTQWRALSDELGIVLVGGFCELGADGHLFNSATLVDRGQVLAVYRKAHLWDTEKLVFTPGDAPPPVVDTTLGRVGVVICYDAEFPEWTRLVGLAGAQILAVPTNWPSSPPAAPRPAGERPMEVVRVQAAASANRMYVVAADRCGTERGVSWVGGSVIVDPDGFPLAGGLATDHAQTLVADVDASQALDKAISPRNDVHQDRRTDLY